MFENAQHASIHLGRFTFDSLYFCQTPLVAYRGDQFCRAVNQWYLPAIRGGTAPPLSFLLDVGNLLLRPSLGFERRPADRVTPQIAALMKKYYQMLVRLREQPIFTEVCVLIESISDLDVQYRAAGQFLKYLLVEFHRHGAALVFESRQLVLKEAKVSAKGLTHVVGHYGKVRLPDTIGREFVSRADRPNEYGPLVELLEWIAEFYLNDSLESFVSVEERLMVELAARNPTGVNAVDFCLVKRLLDLPDIPTPEEEVPSPRFVQMIVPTESMQVDGPTSGYIDVYSKAFSGNVGDILSSELALSVSETQLYQRLLNEGMLHLIRENIECIEKELRVIVGCVVDVQPRMRQVTNAHVDFERENVSPYIRGRALLAGMIRDLARYFPREDVRLEMAIYLWGGSAQPTYRQHFNLLDEVSVDDASDPLLFARRLAAIAPYFFDHRVTPKAADYKKDYLDANPFTFLNQRHRLQNFHCRHTVLLTSHRTASPLLHGLGDWNVLAGPSSPHMNLVVYCDVDYHAAGIAMPTNLNDLARGGAEVVGRLGESDLRARFLEEVLAKAAGRISNPLATELGGLA